MTTRKAPATATPKTDSLLERQGKTEQKEYGRPEGRPFFRQREVR
jgi:hypothetical protein